MKAAILICPSEVRRESVGFVTGAATQAAVAAYEAGRYAERHDVCFNGMPDDTLPEIIAEECFDLTNNPSRQGERELFYGRHASVSIGDIVEVQDRAGNTTAWVCYPAGWKQITVKE